MKHKCNFGLDGNLALTWGGVVTQAALAAIVAGAAIGGVGRPRARAHLTRRVLQPDHVPVHMQACRSATSAAGAVAACFQHLFHAYEHIL